MIKSISIIASLRIKNLRLKKIIFYLKKYTKDYEIIIIDSGSKDGSQKF